MNKNYLQKHSIKFNENPESQVAVSRIQSNRRQKRQKKKFGIHTPVDPLDDLFYE